MLGRILAFGYGIGSYGIFFISFLYAIGFLGNWLVPKTIDSGPAGPLGQSLLVNVALLAVFALQHSVMARPAFKEWWTRLVPPAMERSTYVLVSSVLLLIFFWQWRPLPAVVWKVENLLGTLAINALFWAGWLLVLGASFSIDHFELFGLKQAYGKLAGKDYPPLRFQQPLLYRFVRHPIMLGFLIAFWAAPTMTAGHLLFAVVTTVYILAALQLEERDLVKFHGETYRDYQRQVPMLIPYKFPAP